MDEIINLIIELYYKIAFSDAFNKRRPLKKYAQLSTTQIDDLTRSSLIGSIRESDWKEPIEGVSPKYILFKGKRDFKVYILDSDFHFLRRLYPIINDTGFESLLVEIPD